MSMTLGSNLHSWTRDPKTIAHIKWQGYHINLELIFLFVHVLALPCISFRTSFMLPCIYFIRVHPIIVLIALVFASWMWQESLRIPHRSFYLSPYLFKIFLALWTIWSCHLGPSEQGVFEAFGWVDCLRKPYVFLQNIRTYVDYISILSFHLQIHRATLNRVHHYSSEPSSGVCSEPLNSLWVYKF